MKKLIVFALCALMALSLAACGGNKKTTEIPNPFTEYATLDEAAKAVGFDISVPDAIDGYTERIIRAEVDSKMLEVIYQNGESDEIRIRKAVGAEDISGDLNEYAQSNTAAIGDLSVTMKGENDLVTLATWISNGYTYSIGAYNQAGISAAAMTDLITAVK